MKNPSDFQLNRKFGDLCGKLHDAVNANGLVGHLVNEHVGRVHVLQRHTVGDVVDALAVPVVAEALGRHHLVYLGLGGQALAGDIGLGRMTRMRLSLSRVKPLTFMAVSGKR